MSSELYNRLHALRQRKRQRSGGHNERGGSGDGGFSDGDHRYSRGQEQPEAWAGQKASRGEEISPADGAPHSAGYGTWYRRKLQHHPEWHPVGHNLFKRESLHQSDDLLRLREHQRAQRNHLLLPTEVSADRIAFYDIETTGLSGGAGTMCFLCGIAWLTAEGLFLEQYFAADYDAEPEFLRLIVERFTEAELLVSYNGKSYDSHILRNRCVLNRILPTVTQELDVLYPTRRLYGGYVERCGLTEVTREVLDLPRELDLPGYAIPETYFSYLDNDDDRCLTPLFSHHEQDIVALARLLAAIEQEVHVVTYGDSGTDWFPIHPDQFQLARLLLERSRVEEHQQAAERLLNQLFRNRSGGADRRVASYLAHYLRREGRLEEAASVWRELFERVKLVGAGIELSKLYEHRLGELERAQEILQAMLVWPHARVRRGEVRQRLERVNRKIERRFGRT